MRFLSQLPKHRPARHATSWPPRKQEQANTPTQQAHTTNSQDKFTRQTHKQTCWKNSQTKLTGKLMRKFTLKAHSAISQSKHTKPTHKTSSPNKLTRQTHKHKPAKENQTQLTNIHDTITEQTHKAKSQRKSQNHSAKTNCYPITSSSDLNS